MDSKTKNMKLYLKIKIAFLLFFCSHFVLFAQFGSQYIKFTTTTSNGLTTYHYYPDSNLLEQDYPLDNSNSEAHYSYFWSFGDGHYSFENTPSHSYKSLELRTVMLVGTPRYSPTNPPPVFARKFRTKKGITPANNDDPMLLLNRDPRPGYSSWPIINYENITNAGIQDAKLRLYFNAEFFDYQTYHHFFGETFNGYKEDLSLLPEYTGYLEFLVGDLAPSERRTLMTDLKTTLAAMGEIGEPLPEIFLKATLTYEDRKNSEVLVQSLEITTSAVGGWDPNDKLALTDDVFYDQMNTQEWIDYKVNFQNIGIAPAKTVVIEDTFSSMLDSSHFEMLTFHHPNILIHSGFSHTFDTISNILKATFKNINLSGTKQIGITDPELTKGYITFRIKTKKKKIFNPKLFNSVDSCLPYYRLPNQAYITFDNNDAIATDTAFTDFYASSKAKCFVRDTSRTSIDFQVTPNPVSSKIIKIAATGLPPNFVGFTQNNLTVQIYTSAFAPLGCLSGISFNSSGFQLQPGCLSPGIYHLIISYGGSTYYLTVLVI